MIKEKAFRSARLPLALKQELEHKGKVGGEKIENMSRGELLYGGAGRHQEEHV